MGLIHQTLLSGSHWPAQRGTGRERQAYVLVFERGKDNMIRGEILPTTLTLALLGFLLLDKP